MKGITTTFLLNGRRVTADRDSAAASGFWPRALGTYYYYIIYIFLRIIILYIHRGEVPDEMKTYFSEGGRRHRHHPRRQHHHRRHRRAPWPLQPTRRLVINYYYFGASDVAPAAVQWRLQAQVHTGFREFSISR